MPLPDIEAALASFQGALDAKEISLTKGGFDASVQMLMDRPEGELRLTYVSLEGARVTAMVQMLPGEPYEGQACFGVSWAVPQDLRGQGRAGAMLIAAVEELRFQMSKRGMTEFWIEAVVGIENAPSRRVAEKVVAREGSQTIDAEAGVPILQYFRHVDANTDLSKLP